MLGTFSKRTLRGQLSRNVKLLSLRTQQRSVSVASDGEVAEDGETTARVFVDSVFPVRFGLWDVRYYIGLLREQELLQQIETTLQGVKAHGFRLLSVQPRIKDGGVFVNFTYNKSSEYSLEDVIEEIKVVSDASGGFPSWTGLKRSPGSVWQVKGEPWLEDLHRFASPMLKVEFEGPDIREEGIYKIFRPYGRIMDLTPPAPGAGGALRSSIVTFRKGRASAIARNCVHGFRVENAGGSTRLHTNFEQPLKAHVIRDWASNHPKLVAPVLVFLVGAITYTIFDPLRILCVEGKLLDWFDYRQSTAYQWLRRNTIDRLSFTISKHRTGESNSGHVWKDRQDAEEQVQAYLNDLPSTVTFIHGPQGSGKTSMLFSLLSKMDRPVLTIDCTEISKASSESALLSALARQTGYWPVFPFINSLNNMIDIASVGVIGQKAGLSTSLEKQVQQMLEVVGSGLRAAASHAVKHAEHREAAEARAAERRREEAKRRAAILSGTWHDPRADCLAGNGVMSELGVGDELFRIEDGDPFDEGQTFEEKGSLDHGKHPMTPSEVQALQAKPIVVIKNFTTKRGQDVIINVLAEWAASLASGGVAHVIVVSDNRENAKLLTQALPSKPLHTVALSDADSASALAFVEQKLRDHDAIEKFSSDERKSIERLGGRANDLTTLVHKVRSGQTIDDAVEDIISRGAQELRKNAFGEDSEDAKNLSWTREQAWAIVKQLADKDQISYHSTLLDFPFKGDEMALRNMEAAELISIVTKNGRPSSIRGGRPVYRYVFQRLAEDPAFKALQDLTSNNAKIASAESTIRACEDELAKLSSLNAPGISSWWINPIGNRSRYLLKKLKDAEKSLEKLEAANADLKKILSKTS